MKNIKIKKLGKIQIALLVISSLFFDSCLKNKGPVEDFSQSPALVGFQYGGSAAQTFTAGILGTPTDSFPVEVTLSVASITLKSAVTVTIAPDDASLTQYNSDNGTSYQQLPSNLYTLQNGGVVTINPGQQIVKLLIHFAGDQIDFSQPNALALKITKADGAIVATNLNTAIIVVQLKNPLEGPVTHRWLRWNGLTGAPPDPSVVKPTFDQTFPDAFATVSRTTASIASGTGVTYLVSFDNNGGVLSNFTVAFPTNPNDPGSAAANGITITSGPSIITADPVNHLFDFTFDYLNSSGAPRVIEDKISP